MPVVAERMAAGKARRERAPRGGHAAWAPSPGRVDPIALLRATDRDRIVSLHPIRYGRMVASPLAFLRGAAVVMAHDLVSLPVSGVRHQICGDAHLANFGGFATPERRLVFDLNDFDETLVGPWEWDVKRLAVSVVLAGRENGLGEGRCRAIAQTCAKAYRKRLRELASMRFLDVWYSQVEAEQAIQEFDDDAVADRLLAEARLKTHVGTLPKLVARAADGYRIDDEPPLVVHRTYPVGVRWSEVWSAYRASLPEERRVLLDRYRVVDLARKVVGVGSVGLRCYVALLLGNDEQDPLFLQVKEARRSVWESARRRRPHGNHGKRVVVGQRIMQAASDLLLGWTRCGRRDYYVRQLRDMKCSVPFDELTDSDLGAYAALCGSALARAHACSGDPVVIAGYLGAGASFDRAISGFAVAYADQTERDFERFRSAIRAGRLPAELGV
jgi:uncharacterized protein (DUF2252 family)